MLIASLALPEAFGEHALLFALAYLAIRVLHIALFAAGSREVAVRQAVRALAPSAILARRRWSPPRSWSRPPQALVWLVVLVLDYGGAGVRGIGGWRLSPGHFVERHGLIVIIALGESIVAVGVGAEGSGLGARRAARRRARRGRGRGAVVGVLRRSRAGRRAPARGGAARAASATCSRATPTATCTCRWWPGSCCWRSA